MLLYLSLYDWIALFWFFLCWVGYATFAKVRGKHIPTLSSNLSDIRKDWMRQMLKRDVRIADTTSLGILQRNVTFFASTTIFILAGLLTVLGATDQAIGLISNMPLVSEHSAIAWETKLMLLIYVFVYAFFKFTWSVRKYNFSIMMFGAAPSPDTDDEEKERFIFNADKLLTTASNSFAFGLRAYSFALTILAWFIHPLLFMLACVWVIAVLYRREFHSRSLAALSSINQKKELP
ncbi:DUF599 domain-containing protein [Pleionea sp. CnH1-48]|uniref:DUF599 domain-containing protein n=1 Tax=Pleionea sp. CnH1-48 TaxID=2954494 RepID=UPI00209706EA|nr:DUF599 family protein [Pleionea sp. CnH1-48]MCO7226278.1 DUF599 family protein [Pleionea sp. CnH1-48]